MGCRWAIRRLDNASRLNTPAFACYDVVSAADVDNGLNRLAACVAAYFVGVGSVCRNPKQSCHVFPSGSVLHRC